ncbi:hypothetical protein PC9H_006995 [Pleurotus ostreatus]|uniref:Uncharacterized protein n=1 Tax=Pleurotus ostreatus TaxID=5322 RepID=A0A8H6ZQA4_PLEOS|nr:uncharacterized protein PC9H_006995 [Pleurotus ostreatus]KAF7427780.1 hypothetical protein PC9H_006995 [Pleurotus ostreatus]
MGMCCDECPLRDRHDTDNTYAPTRSSAAPRTPHTLSPGHPTAGAAWLLLPTHTMPAKAQRRGVDIPGVLVLTSGLILFVYAISDRAESGMSSLSLLSFHSLENRPYPTQGWGSPQVVTTLLLSVVVFVVVLRHRADREKPGMAAQDVDEQELHAAVLPCLESPLVVPRLSALNSSLSTSSCPALMALGAVLFAVAGGARAEARYWSYIFSGMAVSVFGLAGAYVGCTAMVMGGARKGRRAASAP